MNTGTNYADLFFSNIPNDADSLENNVKEYPFSSVARFMLLYHYKKNNNVAFENFAKQTGIYINNPFWLQYQLSKISDASFAREDSFQSELQNKTVEENFPVAAEESDLLADQQITPIPVSENEVINDNEIKDNSYQEEKQNENIEQNIPEAAGQQITPIPGFENEVFNDNAIKDNSYQEEKQNENIEQNVTEAADQQITPIPVSENEVFNDNAIKDNSYQEEKQNENIEQNISDAADQQITPIPVSENEVINDNEIKDNSYQEEKQNENTEENITEAGDQQITPIPVSENEVFNDNAIRDNSYQEEKQNENTEENITEAGDQQITPIPVSENEVFNDNAIKDNSYQEEKQNENIEQNISDAADQQITTIPVSENGTKEETETSPVFETELKDPGNKLEDLIPFEPLHTVDYFASQGIKISEEALENDHLGKQVKSFTAWLKSMKKLHPGQMPEQNEVIEKIIQANAEVSNQNANVLTEAMAEVLIKQNKKEKAIEMYQKLSLINPSKSAYFAAKIESLKII